MSYCRKSHVDACFLFLIRPSSSFPSVRKSRNFPHVRNVPIENFESNNVVPLLRSATNFHSCPPLSLASLFISLPSLPIYFSTIVSFNPLLPTVLSIIILTFYFVINLFSLPLPCFHEVKVVKLRDKLCPSPFVCSPLLR